MSLYIGVDFHPHQQTACWIDSQTGELKIDTFHHQNRDELTRFYQSLPPSVVGIEATGKASWFEDLLFENNHQLLVGDPCVIRKRATSIHKSDKRDAEHIFNLLSNNEFPTLWRRAKESSNLLELIKLRSSLVRQRTQIYNRLQALAHEVGLPKGKMETKHFQTLLQSVELTAVKHLQRDTLFQTTEFLSQQISQLEKVLQLKAEEDEQVKLLLSQRGVGFLTALCVVHTLGDVQRFNSTKKISSFVGICPVEKSSGSRVKFGSISKKGSALLRFFLGQSANIAIRYDDKLKAFYQRLSKKKPKAVAKTAVSRKLLVKLSIMLRDKITAPEFDLRGRTVGNARANKGQKMTAA
jgi:transposase